MQSTVLTAPRKSVPRARVPNLHACLHQHTLKAHIGKCLNSAVSIQEFLSSVRLPENTGETSWFNSSSSRLRRSECSPAHRRCCFNRRQTLSPFFFIKPVGRGMSTPGRRCEDKESGEEQKVNVANEKVRMCLENREWGRLSSQMTGNCVFCHIKFDARPVCDWSGPLPLAATVAQACDVVYMKASPPLSQGAINRGREASGSQCNGIKPNQPQLPVFYWTYIPVSILYFNMYKEDIGLLLRAGPSLCRNIKWT